MNDQLVTFRITSLTARVPEGVALAWQGKEFLSGPLVIGLDEDTSSAGNRGVLDYSRCRVRATFQVLFSFPDFARTLEELGVDPELTSPMRATLHSEGKIVEDHSFVLSGPCDLAPHALLTSPETTACVLPGQ
jgi:hypothetical protein